MLKEEAILNRTNFNEPTKSVKLDDYMVDSAVFQEKEEKERRMEKIRQDKKEQTFPGPGKL